MVLFELAGSGNFGSNRCTPPEDDKPSNFQTALVPTAAEGTEDCGISVVGPGKGLEVLDKVGKYELAMILGGVHAAKEVFGFLVGVLSSGSGRALVNGSVLPGKGLCLFPCPRGKGLPAAGSLPPTAGTSLRIPLQEAASMGARRAVCCQPSQPQRMLLH